MGKDISYRIGGDEFCSILTGDDAANCKNYIKLLQKTVKIYAEDHEKLFGCRVAIAVGASDYSIADNDAFSDVFKRADALMYEDKRRIKGL